MTAETTLTPAAASATSIVSAASDDATLATATASVTLGNASPPTSTTLAPVSPTTTPPAVPVAPPVEEQTVLNPRVKEIKAIFPDFDEQVLLSVLDSCDGNQDLAVEMLLEMSNPSYKANVTVEHKTQAQLDEELARRLAEEEEYAAAAAWNPQQSQQRQQQRIHRPSPRRSSSSPSSRGAPENDTFAQVQQQALKYAEIGKKTLFSFAQKVKEKIQELDQPSQGPTAGGSGGRAPDGGYHGQPYQPQQPQWYSSEPPRQQQAYKPPPPMSSDGYDVEPHAGARTASPQHMTAASTTSNATSQPVSIPIAPARPATVSTSPSQVGGLSSSPAPPATIDTARLGILPKRPVSLIDPGTGSQPPQHVVGDDDDDLEYVENPFDDKRR
ncbi:hypothetical protein BKA62DRAFT_764300 [Auriculariales sp. MPI-PUGE-AT-0066]|nr:hypothetical protein BKA62DRAFT_764300 [Auriculariales sp. MPI-PUGE-AT-0066]